MDTVIKKISEIEEAASSIMEAANIRKKAFAQELAKRTEDFDHQLDLMTEQQLTDLLRPHGNRNAGKSFPNSSPMLISCFSRWNPTITSTIRNMPKNCSNH